MIFIIVIGTLLHFTYKWSGYNPIVGIFSAVNESQWEHFKLGVWPALIYAIIEYPFIKDCVNNYIIAKTISIYSIPIIIYILFNLYTAIIGTHILVVDIGIFILSAIVSQLISYSILTLGYQLPTILSVISMYLLKLLLLFFILFTFFPPKLPVFKDSTTGSYGVK